MVALLKVLQSSIFSSLANPPTEYVLSGVGGEGVGIVQRR